ncbi:MAG: DNA polymerase III subunit gamma/tau, partial [Candidatus Omnitrophica bacterium]|nr:DNA polymerase III subunit gamma/tau [Candidatus Omnitrophota bacterium]
GPTPTPCGKCASCQEIARGTSLDIIEIDGASNRGIDEIRALRENVRLSPAHARYKIYIIDEVHMLTQEAFNALLKTLEEPPAHVKFIFATTHPQKVLPTILSRCQKFQFNLLDLDTIVRKLKQITKTENIDIQDNLLYSIARAGAGSVRDAESLLDQLAPMISAKGDLNDIFSFLGIINEDLLNDVVALTINRNLIEVLAVIERIVASGKDLGVFLNALIEHLRNLLLAKVSEKNFKALIEISPDTKSVMLSLTAKIKTKDLLSLIDSLIEAKFVSSQLNTVRIPLELAMIKFAYQGLGDDVVFTPLPAELSARDKKPQKVPVKENNRPDDRPDAFGLDVESFDLSVDKSSFSGTQIPDKDSAGSGTQNVVADDYMVTEFKAKWKAIVQHIQKTRAAIASHLSFARPVSSLGNVVTVGFDKKNYFHKEIVESGKNQKFIEEVISILFKREIGIRFVLLDGSLPIDSSSEISDYGKSFPDQQKPDESIDPTQQDNDFINDLLDTFGGKIHTEE